MEDEIMQTISFPAEQLTWEKKEKEIILDGRMFDIREYRITNGVFTATGYFDEKESMIRELLQHAGSRQQTASVIQLLFFAQCFAFMICWIAYQAGYLLVKRQKDFYINSYLAPFPAIQVPPPRIH